MALRPQVEGAVGLFRRQLCDLTTNVAGWSTTKPLCFVGYLLLSEHLPRGMRKTNENVVAVFQGRCHEFPNHLLLLRSVALSFHLDEQTPETAEGSDTKVLTYVISTVSE